MKSIVCYTVLAIFCAVMLVLFLQDPHPNRFGIFAAIMGLIGCSVVVVHDVRERRRTSRG